MSRLGQFIIELDGVTHTVDYKRIDLVRFELDFDKPTREMGGMVDQYRLGWIAARREGLAVPATFDAFLAAAPDVDMTDDEDDDTPKEPSGETALTSTRLQASA